MMGLLAVARSVCALGREHFLPPVTAWVSSLKGWNIKKRVRAWRT